MMFDKPQISVIIPVYNAEKTIAKCIDSVIAQTYQDFEILLIDDGSKDDSDSVCQSYAMQDKRIRYIHKENGGVSTARNLGIDEAKGQYVTFLDSDDWFETHTLEVLISNARRYDADLVIPRTRMVFCKTNGEFEKNAYNDDDYNLVVAKNELAKNFEKLTHTWALYSTCGRLFNRQILVKENVRFDINVKVLEDFCFNMVYIEHIHTLVHISEVLYNFYILGIQNYATKRRYQDYIISNEKVYEYLSHFCSNHNLIISTAQYDFLMGYWIAAINGAMNSADSLSKKRMALKQIRQCVSNQKIYDNCTQAGVDRKYRALFGHRSLLPFYLIYYLKKVLHK